MGAPDVAVVLPARDEGPTLAAAVRSVLAQEVPAGLEVCVAVGPSGDDTRSVADDLAAADPRVTVVDNPAGVTPAGLNAAIRATSAPVVVRVDGHAELPAGYVTRAVETLERTGAVNVGGIQDPRGTTAFEVAVGRAMASRLGAGDARFHYGGPEGAVDTVYLGVFRRESIEAVGLFDEGYRPRGSVRALARQFGQYGRWKRIVLGMHPRSMRWRHLVAPTTTVVVAVGLVAGAWWPPLLVLPAGYGAAVVVGSVAVGRTPATMLRLLVVYPTMHLSWGTGFLWGLCTRSPDTRRSGNRSSDARASGTGAQPAS